MTKIERLDDGPFGMGSEALIPLDAGLCITNDLAIADGTYALEFVLRQNGAIVADQSFAGVHLYSGNWSKSFDPPAPGGTYNLQLFVDGVLIGESRVLVPGPTPTPPPLGPIWGDLNCNGGVGVTDVMLGLKIVAALLSSLSCAASADVDCNGVVNGLDVLDLLRFVVHLPSLVTGNCRAIGSA
jgi:hypothetical protein